MWPVNKRKTKKITQAKDFVRKLLCPPAARMSAEEASQHPWLVVAASASASTSSSASATAHARYNHGSCCNDNSRREASERGKVAGDTTAKENAQA
jgi:hypothetical protein